LAFPPSGEKYDNIKNPFSFVVFMPDSQALKHLRKLVVRQVVGGSLLVDNLPPV
jgi:hypothetical protein